MLNRFTKQETGGTAKDAFITDVKSAPVIREKLMMNQNFSPENFEYLKSNMQHTEDEYKFCEQNKFSLNKLVISFIFDLSPPTVDVLLSAEAHQLHLLLRVQFQFVVHLKDVISYLLF